MFDPNFHDSAPLRQYEVNDRYVCKRCNEGGHHILNCPTILDPSFDVPPESDYECSVCHKVGVHFGTLCPENLARNSITQQRFRHTTFMERTKKPKSAVREDPNNTEGRLKFSDKFESLAMQDTEMGGVRSIYHGGAFGLKCGNHHLGLPDKDESANDQDKEIETDTKLHPDRALQLEMNQHIPMLYEDSRPTRATSGANSQPVISRAISGMKRKMGEWDLDDERNKKSVKLSFEKPQVYDENYSVPASSCPFRVKDTTVSDSPFRLHLSEYVMSLFGKHPNITFERKPRTTALDMWNKDEEELTMRDGSFDEDYYSCTSSVPTSPFANDNFSDEETASQNYEADNEREQYQQDHDIPMPKFPLYEEDEEMEFGNY